MLAWLRYIALSCVGWLVMGGWVVFGNTLSFLSCFSFPSFVTSHSKVDLRSQIVVQYLYSVVFAKRDA